MVSKVYNFDVELKYGDTPNFTVKGNETAKDNYFNSIKNRDSDFVFIANKTVSRNSLLAVTITEEVGEK